MPEQLYDERASDHGAERRYPEYGAYPAVTTPAPRQDRNRWLAFLLIGLGVAMLLSNLGHLPFAPGIERTQTYDVDVPLDHYERANITVDWGSGPLRLSGGGVGYIVTGSVEGRDEPEIEVDEDDGVAEVWIDDDDGWLFGSSHEASGRLLLDPSALYRLDLDLGSGRTELDLSDVRVEVLELDAGSGDVDLVMPHDSPMRAAIDAGTGSVALTLPPDVEARVMVDQGSGSFDPGERLERIQGDEDDDRVYETPGYTTSSAGIEIEIDGGSGTITIR